MPNQKLAQVILSSQSLYNDPGILGPIENSLMDAKSKFITMMAQALALQKYYYYYYY